MWQDPRLWRPFITGPDAKPEAAQSSDERVQTQAYWDSRSQAEQDDFRWALHNTMDLWYSHQGTTVYMLTADVQQLSAWGSTRPNGYSDSGWVRARVSTACLGAWAGGCWVPKVAVVPSHRHAADNLRAAIRRADQEILPV